MITEFNNEWEEDHNVKTTSVLQSMIDKKNAAHKKKAKTVRDRNKAADTQLQKRRLTCSFYFTTEVVKKIESKEDTSLTVMCQVGGIADCNKSIPMTNGGTQGVLQHFLKCHPALNVKISTLQVTSGADKKTSTLMILTNQSVPGIEEQQSSIMQSLNRAITRGDRGYETLTLGPQKLVEC
jgi:hypothetical protein